MARSRPGRELRVATAKRLSANNANGPKRNPATASGACIAKPRLYAGFHSMSKVRSSSSNRAGCLAMLT